MNAQETLEKSLKKQKRDALDLMKMVEDGTMPKTQIDTRGLETNPDMIDTKANLKEQFSKLTMNRQPRPGPGSYSLAGSFAKVEKPREH